MLFRERWSSNRQGNEEMVVAAEETRLIEWAELPDWQKRGTELIHSGYR